MMNNTKLTATNAAAPNRKETALTNWVRSEGAVPGAGAGGAVVGSDVMASRIVKSTRRRERAQRREEYRRGTDRLD
jgi:hypothetical protein